jgi:hypothetical protein
MVTRIFDAEFVIGHRGNTVPERSGVALSFRGRQVSLGGLAPGVRIVVASPNFPENAYRGRKETVRVVLFT